ncbi:transposon Ty3-I Gag-Pol polyprotein [Trichonephila clavipes]|nr:transposon Ty3-I Gag-Pol polyprotein [Trichonephila clavipes]
MQANIIKTVHERGHFAILRTQDLVSKDFYIPRFKDKVEKCIQNCVTCILTNRKRGKQDGTCTDAAEVINRLENQRHVFRNPARIITDKGSAFTSSAFEVYCKKQNILHISITTGLPRSNGQIEKQNSTIISVLSKLSVDDPEKWYSHVPHLQEILNSTFQRSIKMTPFELLFGTKMKSCQDIEIVELLNDEITAQFQEQRDAHRQDAKKQIYKVQDENRRTYNLRRRQAHKYQLHDLVAIKRTQFGPGLKLKQKYLGPYKVTKVKHNDTYDVEKCDFVDGPSKTFTCAEFMKLWPN